MNSNPFSLFHALRITHYALRFTSLPPQVLALLVLLAYFSVA